MSYTISQIQYLHLLVATWRLKKSKEASNREGLLDQSSLKMLGLYLYTIIIGQKYCNMLSFLNKLIFQKYLQKFATNTVFWTKK